VNLKHRLRQIETDERRRHRTISVMKEAYPLDCTAVPEMGGRSSHHADGSVGMYGKHAMTDFLCGSDRLLIVYRSG
jgi:hypothetical protein